MTLDKQCLSVTHSHDTFHTPYEHNHFQHICHAMPVPVVVLNHEFEVVMANELSIDLLGFHSLNQLMGTTLIFSSDLRSKSDPWHCIYIAGHELPLQNIQIDAKKITAENSSFYVVALTDFSAQKRQRSMEQIFFHDILNTAGGMQGISEVLLEAEPDEVPELQDSVHNLAAQLVEEITAQRDFVAAENGELKVRTTRIQSRLLMKNLAQTYGNHPASGQRHITIQEDNGPLQFISDPVLLNRVLGNMIKNALEASIFPEKVTLVSCMLEKELGKPRQIDFSVHNPGYIADENQDHIFQQSFSTKGVGRGLGTFSMRMLAEKYLGGQVKFKTDPATGTTFTLTLPLAGP